MNADILKRGVVSGIVGALVIVLWFLLTDTIRGEPLATARFVSAALLGGPALAAIPAYTILHFMSFQVIGFASAWALDSLKVVAPTLLGLALGALLFDMIFYGSVMATGADIVQEFGWRNVLAGNVLAGLAITHTIHRMARSEASGWVALWFLVLDTLTGEPLRTPSALGGLVFAGETEAASMPVRTSWVVGYTGVHLAIGLVLGMVLAAASAAVEESPPLVLATALAFVCFEALMMGIVGVVSVFLPYSWVVVGGANLLAAVTMVVLLWRRHPRLGHAMGDDMVPAAGG